MAVEVPHQCVLEAKVAPESYWAVVGKYARIENRETDEGGEGLVAEFRIDPDGSPWLIFDYGYGFDMTTFTITGLWPDEATRDVLVQGRVE